MKLKVLFFLVFSYSYCVSQEAYNNCNNALELCPNISSTVNNIGANKTFCPGCEDDFTFCLTPQNSIWLKFTTNATGGAIQINFSNLIFQNQAGQDNRYNATLIQATVPCNSASYTQIGNCISAATGNQTINAASLAANTTFYIVLSGEKSGAGITLPAEFTVTTTISGTAIDRPVPYLNIGIQDTVCENTLVAVMTDRINCDDASDFRWYVNGELTATTSDSLYFTDKLKDGDVIRVESDCFTTCPYTVHQTLAPITVYSVIADAGEDATIRPGESIQLNGTVSIGSEVNWLPSYALSNDSITFPIANPFTTTTYMLTVKDTATGCTAFDYVTITVDDGLFIPTTFSPNGDGENDTWEIIGIENYPDCYVSIFDRWGQIVYEAVGYNKEKAWNGKGKSGRLLNESVYFYKIQLLDSEKQELKGSITVIR